VILFVTGTDTGVGKTFVSAALAREAAANGARVRYVKPLQTGLLAGEEGSDADIVRALAEVEAKELFRFDAPLAPAAAAALEGRTVDVRALVSAMEAEAREVDVLVVEGAGGLLVPVTGEATMADLAVALRAPLVVVARPGLGTLNHTALTLEAAARRGLAVDRIVVSAWPDAPGVTELTNLDRILDMRARVELLPFFEEGARLPELRRVAQGTATTLVSDVVRTTGRG
jgi:dethiobiotin synthetase